MDEKLNAAQKALNVFEKESEMTVSRLKEKIKQMNPTQNDSSIVENIPVETSDRKGKISEFALVKSSFGRNIEIRLFDSSTRKNIQEAIDRNGSKFMTIISSESDRIIVKLDDVTSEYLIEVYQILHKEAENSKILIRDIRRKVHKEIQNIFGANKDSIKKHEKKLQDLIDKRSNEISTSLEVFKKAHIPHSVWNEL